jgi:hypothetical protein
MSSIYAGIFANGTLLVARDKRLEGDVSQVAALKAGKKTPFCDAILI